MALGKWSRLTEAVVPAPDGSLQLRWFCKWWNWTVQILRPRHRRRMEQRDLKLHLTGLHSVPSAMETRTNGVSSVMC